MDYPVGFFSYRVGAGILDVSADRWSRDDTFGIAALREVCTSEFGRFFVQRDGTLTFLDRLWFFMPISPSISLDLHPFKMEVDLGDIYNTVQVNVYPRVTDSVTTVLAQATSTLKVPPRTVEGPGVRTITLRFRDAFGNKVGGTDLVIPLVANTDYTVNDRPSGAGVDYTSSPVFSFGALDLRGSEIVIELRNQGLVPLYMTKLQVRGKTVTAFDPQGFVETDEASKAQFGDRPFLVRLALSGDSVFGQSLAQYLLDLLKTAQTGIAEVTFDKLPVVAGVNVFSLDLFTAIVGTDPQTGLTAVKAYVVGQHVKLTARGFVLVLRVSRVDDRKFWNLGVAGYGELDENTRLAV
jgi:hypothetical protein